MEGDAFEHGVGSPHNRGQCGWHRVKKAPKIYWQIAGLIETTCLLRRWWYLRYYRSQNEQDQEDWTHWNQSRVDRTNRLDITHKPLEIVSDQKQSSDFMSMSRELEPAGVMFDDKTFKFAFTKFEKQHESYYGNTVRLRYYLRVSMNRNYGGKISKEIDFAVLLP